MPQVFVNGLPVGELSRGGVVPNLFVYSPRLDADHAVSLLMPTSEHSFDSLRPGQLHPIFEQNLPEGALRDALQRMFSKALPIFDDFALLELVGRSLIGRLRFAQTLSDLAKAPPAQNLSALLEARGTADLFRELLERYATQSGISGVQPKLLVRSDGALSSSPMSSAFSGAGRTTYPGATHIIKGFDEDRLPELAANEYACLMAARHAGISTPRVELAKDRGLLVVERFDLKSEGGYLGFEDMCSLCGRLTRDKYDGSYEQIAKALRAFCSRETLAEDCLSLFKSIALSCMVRNGDAHRKNFGVLYDYAECGPIRLAPAYDIITTTAYNPGDTLALTMAGTKRWPAREGLIQFGRHHCQLSQEEVIRSLDEVREGVRAAEQYLSLIVNPTIRGAVQVAWAEGSQSLAG